MGVERGPGAPFKYRFFGAIKQLPALVLSLDVSAPVCVRAHGVRMVGAISWEL